MAFWPTGKAKSLNNQSVMYISFLLSWVVSPLSRGIVGAVGSTGFSTGPHLHFEFRIDGEHKDPLTIVAEGGGAAPLSAAAKPVFDRASVFMRGQLAQAASVRLASAE